MSLHREHVIWQSKNKRWNIGFFTVIHQGSEMDGFDHEWDVDYDYHSFGAAMRGYDSAEDVDKAARRIYPNYGSTNPIPYSKNEPAIEEYDYMALCVNSPAEAELVLKKKNDKLRRAHRAKLKALFEENDDFRHKVVSVVTKQDKEVWTHYGITSEVRDFASIKDDCVVVKGVVIKNLKTGRINPKIHSIKAVPF